MIGPQVPYSQELHAQKYRGAGESFREAMNRIASGLKDDDRHYADFRECLLDMRFLPAGRIQSAIGSTRQVTPYNCYVSGTIEDSFISNLATEGRGPMEAAMADIFHARTGGSIMEMAKEAAATMRMGGGIGYDFSTLRPRGDLIRKLQSHSSGPISFMHIFDAVCRCVASSGHRRGAQMGVLRVDHPDIEEFIRAKQPPAEIQPLWDMVRDLPEGPVKAQAVQSLQRTLTLTGFNVSVAITDRFMECVESGEPFQLTFNGTNYRTVNAAALWEMIMRATWDWAEPGVLFIDAINRLNNLYYCETIAATNPCFTGDEKVWTDRGNFAFKDLVGKTVRVLTQDWNGKLVYRPMSNIRKTRRNAKLVEVRFTDGQKVRCTPNHMFFLRSGGQMEAERLQPGMSISSVYRYKANSSGYLRLSNSDFHFPLEHHVPFEDGVPEGYHAHHIDGVKRHNWSENIELVEASLHNSQHMLGDANPARRFPERNHFANTSYAGEKNGRWRGDLSTQAILEDREAGMSFQDIATKHGCSAWLARERVLANNHTIESVTLLDYREDVYCGAVDEFSRFFLALGDNDGVLVHNCGEQPLPPYGACLLGSFNLAKYVTRTGTGFDFSLDQFREDIPVVVRAMDNVVDRAIYPLPQQAHEAKSKRRMGLGVTGLANAGEALGFPYGSGQFLRFEAEILDVLRDESYKASAKLAGEKGSFPLFDRDKYLAGAFAQTLSDEARQGIAENGIRNSHLTSIAPTGTISLCADNISSGIEPVFAYSFDRQVIEFSGTRTETVTDYGARVFGVKGKRADEATVEEHVAVLTTAAVRVDSAVSKTCNVPSDISWEAFKNTYVSAWRGGAKGCTTFRLGGMRSGILVSNDSKDEPSEASPKAEEEAGPSCRVDPATGRRECD